MRYDEHVQEVTDKIDNLYIQTSKYLSRAKLARERYMKAADNYETAFHRASGARGLCYENPLGVRIQGGHSNRDDAMVDLIEKSKICDNALLHYQVCRFALIMLLNSSGMTNLQKEVVWQHEFLGKNFADISRDLDYHETNNPSAAIWNVYKRAFVKAATWLEKVGNIDENA